MAVVSSCNCVIIIILEMNTSANCIKQLALAQELLTRAYLLPQIAKLFRNCTSKGTGRPVAPFALPPREAVPATSKCAQAGVSAVKRARNAAADDAPPVRPPMLAMSAKFDFNISSYSLSIGIRHTVSIEP